MAYDPNDAKDKATVKKLIDDAVAEALTEAKETHETEVAGLKAKRDELVKEVRGLKKKVQSGTEDPEAMTRLETELEATKEKLTKAEGDLKTATKDAAKVAKSLETETEFNRRLLVDGGLTQELVKANVAKELLPAVTALLGPRVTIDAKGGERKAMVGDKELGAFIAEWSQGDEGKHFISARANNGSGANGGGAKGSAKSVTRAAFDGMSAEARMAHTKEGGVVV